VRVLLQAPAKVNLFLSVGRPDQTGYHPIRSVFQTIALFDEIEISSIGEGLPHEVSFLNAQVPAQNTVTKALDLLASHTEIPSVRVVVNKRIPECAGLGGGSSDAAAVLKAMNDHAKAPLPESELRKVAAKIGADVPFFLVGGRARVEGYGEILTPEPDLSERWMIVCQPSTGCSTPEMYRKLDEKSYLWREFPESDILYNDFERVAPCECLDLIERVLRFGATDAGLSGSGSAVFGRFAGQEAAEGAAASVLQEGIPFAQAVPTLPKS
jgi:4-diphosphocytidyl-2-C-methyl-D-erythritol kinase